MQYKSIFDIYLTTTTNLGEQIKLPKDTIIEVLYLDDKKSYVWFYTPNTDLVKLEHPEYISSQTLQVGFSKINL